MAALPDSFEDVLGSGRGRGPSQRDREERLERLREHFRVITPAGCQLSAEHRYLLTVVRPVAGKLLGTASSEKSFASLFTTADVKDAKGGWIVDLDAPADACVWGISASRADTDTVSFTWDLSQRAMMSLTEFTSGKL